MMTFENVKTLLSIFQHAGVDEVLSLLPHDRFHEIEDTLILPSASAPPQQEQKHLQTAPLMSPKAACETAETLAHTAQTLEDLKAALLAFEGCSLKYTATNLVFGDGKG